MSLIKLHEQYVKSLKDKHESDSMTENEQWHFERLQGIGGSDVATILGLNKYKTRHQLWLEKTGRVEPEDLSNNELVHFGNVLEDVVAQEYARRKQVKIERRNKSFIDKHQPWLRANIDRVVVGMNKVLECKTANAFTANFNWGESGTDEVPESYILQCQHYMHVLDKDSSDLAVLIGGNDFRIYPIARNDALIRSVNEQLATFWFDNVIADIPPEPQTLTELSEFYPKDNGESVIASNHALDAISQIKHANDLIKEAKELIDEQKAIVQKEMGEHQLLIDFDGSKLVSWKSSTRKTIDSKRLKSEQPEIAEQYLKTSESRTFKVA